MGQKTVSGRVLPSPSHHVAVSPPPAGLPPARSTRAQSYGGAGTAPVAGSGR